MAKYYNADTLLEFVKNNTPTIDGHTTLQCVERAINEAPTADVVEVVRCKDCVHGEFGIFNGQGEKDGCYCNLNGEGYVLDWYCKGGERRTDND